MYTHIFQKFVERLLLRTMNTSKDAQSSAKKRWWSQPEINRSDAVWNMASNICHTNYVRREDDYQSKWPSESCSLIVWWPRICLFKKKNQSHFVSPAEHFQLSPRANAASVHSVLERWREGMTVSLSHFCDWGQRPFAWVELALCRSHWLQAFIVVRVDFVTCVRALLNFELTNYSSNCDAVDSHSTRSASEA